MNEWIEEVSRFQNVFEKKLDDVQELISLRVELVDEEIYELWHGLDTVLEGMQDDDPEIIKKGRIETLDAIADSIVVLIGTANALKMDLDEAMKRVFESNLSKMGEDGRPFYNEDGKVMKGPNFRPPKLEDLV